MSLGDDFEKWLEDGDNLRELCDEIGANWALVRRFLIEFLTGKGFTVISEDELRRIRDAIEEAHPYCKYLREKRRNKK